jgi:hypothetical protein
MVVNQLLWPTTNSEKIVVEIKKCYYPLPLGVPLSSKNITMDH